MKNYITYIFILFTYFLFSGCKQNVYKQGESIYIKNCSPCHGREGKGLNALIPPLADSDYYLNHKDKIACIIRNGLKDTILVNGQLYSEIMAPIPQLNNVEICNLINYIDTKFYKSNSIIPLSQITENISRCN